MEPDEDIAIAGKPRQKVNAGSSAPISGFSTCEDEAPQPLTPEDILAIRSKKAGLKWGLFLYFLLFWYCFLTKRTYIISRTRINNSVGQGILCKAIPIRSFPALR